MASQTPLTHCAVFIDRDGVINRSKVKDGKPYAPRKLSEFRLLPGVTEAVANLKASGYVVIVVTNQPDVGHGLISRDTLDAMHKTLSAKVPVDEIVVCPHRQDEGCSCRKPKPGLINQAMQRWNADPGKSYMIGDRWSDIEAGHAAGLHTILVRRDYAESLRVQPDLTVGSLKEAAVIILKNKHGGEQ